MSLNPGVLNSQFPLDHLLELLQVAEGIIYHPEHDDLSLPDDTSPVDPGDGNRQLERARVVAEGEVEGMRWELVAYQATAVCALICDSGEPRVVAAATRSVRSGR